MACYRGWAGKRGMGWVGGGEVDDGGGWVAEGGLYLPLGQRQQCCVFSK